MPVSLHFLQIHKSRNLVDSNITHVYTDMTSHTCVPIWRHTRVYWHDVTHVCTDITSHTRVPTWRHTCVYRHDVTHVCTDMTSHRCVPIWRHTRVYRYDVTHVYWRDTFTCCSCDRTKHRVKSVTFHVTRSTRVKNSHITQFHTTQFTDVITHVLAAHVCEYMWANEHAAHTCVTVLTWHKSHTCISSLSTNARMSHTLLLLLFAFMWTLCHIKDD